MVVSRRIAGVVPIVPTPFAEDGSLDLPSLRDVVDYLVDGGVHGLAVLGVASEIYALTDGERVRVVETAVEQARGRVPVLAGSSHGGAEAAAAAAREAAAAGAGLLLVMPPHFVKPDAAALRDYFARVAAAAGVPVMVQDNPSWTGVQISPDAFARLAEVEGIEYAKIEEPHPPTKLRAVRETAGESLTLFGGLAGNWLPEELAAGSVGTMPAAIMPQVFVRVWELWQEGDRAGARSLFHRYHPAIRVTAQQTVGFAMVKHLLWQLGVIRSPAVRNPLRPLAEDDRLDLEAVVGELDLLEVMRGGPLAS